MRHFTWYLSSTLFLVFACAVMEPPTGGPEDKTPPELIEIKPAENSTGVSRTKKVEIIFSEKLDSESLRKRIIVYPEVTFKKIDVSGNRVEIQFEELLPETTLSFYLKKGYTDNHNVESERSEIFYFSTADSLEKGIITGDIKFKNIVAEDGIAKLTSSEPDTFEHLYQKPELRTAEADENGSFSFRYLPTDSSGFRIWAFVDTDNNGDFSASKEFYIIHPDTIYLTGLNSIYSNFVLNIIDPDEPGKINGIIKNSTSFDKIITMRLRNVSEDKKDYEVFADSAGVYKFESVLPGDYLLSAFIDINDDSTKGYYADPEDSSLTHEEPGISLRDTINLKPAEIEEIENLELGND
ncbi:MAG: Ig-like domain-containing protein [Candidatus Krumholzibacteriota bacterium]|nr:Ig-like domain-containing protein [Candidatus Krumholzibacteriota bacterium]